MPNTFKLKTKDGSAVAANTEQTIYTVPASTTTVVIGMIVANLSNNSIMIDVKIENFDGNNINIGKNLPIPTGSTLNVLGTAGKMVLETSDVLKIQSNTINSVDTALTIMEIT